MLASWISAFHLNKGLRVGAINPYDKVLGFGTLPPPCYEQPDVLSAALTLLTALLPASPCIPPLFCRPPPLHPLLRPHPNSSLLVFVNTCPMSTTVICAFQSLNRSPDSATSFSDKETESQTALMICSWSPSPWQSQGKAWSRSELIFQAQNLSSSGSVMNLYRGCRTGDSLSVFLHQGERMERGDLGKDEY